VLFVSLRFGRGSRVGLLRGGLAFDHTGVWNGDLIVSTNQGRIYRVNATAHATLVGNANEFVEVSACVWCGNDRQIIISQTMMLIVAREQSFFWRICVCVCVCA
jgi:hypothetical protein